MKSKKAKMEHIIEVTDWLERETKRSIHSILISLALKIVYEDHPYLERLRREVKF